ncbi:hypothetical protein HZC53_02275 [Candidatus Uhrbacteria bacterium]|nr:hypothetical protein [Candidatus Uhrbacteria bacterium]
MSKRTKLALVILIALLLLLVGLYLILWPLLKPAPAPATGEEYSVTTQVQPAQPKPTNGQATSGEPVTGLPSAPTREPSVDEILRGLENRARAAVERVGSGSSQTGFLGYADAKLDSTSGFSAKLMQEQEAMVAAHPASGPIYGISTRAASSNIADGKPGDDSLIATVQAVQTIDAGNPRQPTSTGGKQIIVTFAKQSDGSYLIDNMEWSDLAL